MFGRVVSYMIINLDSTQSSAVPKHLKIGSIFELLAFPRVIVWKGGYELFYDKVSQKGGLLVGKERYLIDLYVEDSGFNSDGATKTARKSMIINRDFRHMIKAFL